MIVDKVSQSLLLKLRQPEAVTSVVPGSDQVDYQGTPITRVPFSFESAKILRNIGLNAPSPILHQYSWPGRFTPYDHQKETSAFMTMNRRCIVLNEMGLGKSLSFLWAADYLMSIGVIRKAIIVAPISTMYSVWANEITAHFFHRNCQVLHGSRQKRLDRLADPDADFYIINHDGLKTVRDSLKKRDDIDLWGLDEAAVFRNPQTNRFKMLTSLLPKGAWLWMMTGTPCPTGPTDAWALAKLLRNPKAPKYQSAFRDMTMRQITTYKWVPKPDAYATAYSVLQPGIRYTKADCLKDLPPLTFQLRQSDMTTEQQRLYREMQRELVMEVGANEITAANAAVKLLKLLQVSTGAVYDEDSQTLKVDARHRLEVLRELVEESARKVVVFVPFTAALEAVQSYLSKWWTVARVDGSTSVTQRRQIFQDFQNSDKPEVIVAHPRTTAHGLTLTAADHTIWYAPIFSLEAFEQANNRMDRPGQNWPMTISMISANKLERELYKALYNKQKMQDSVLSLYKNLTA